MAPKHVAQNRQQQHHLKIESLYPRKVSVFSHVSPKKDIEDISPFHRNSPKVVAAIGIRSQLVADSGRIWNLTARIPKMDANPAKLWPLMLLPEPIWALGFCWDVKISVAPGCVYMPMVRLSAKFNEVFRKETQISEQIGETWLGHLCCLTIKSVDLAYGHWPFPNTMELRFDTGFWENNRGSRCKDHHLDPEIRGLSNRIVSGSWHSKFWWD